MTPKLWQYSSDVTYLEEKSKKLGKSLSRLNKIRKDWAEKESKPWRNWTKR